MLKYYRIKDKQEICVRIYDENGISVFDHFSNKLNRTFPFVHTLLMIAFCVCVSIGVNVLLQTHNYEIIANKNKDSWYDLN